MRKTHFLQSPWPGTCFSTTPLFIQMLQRLQGHCPHVSFAWHWRVIDKIIIIIKCLPGECVIFCPIKTRYWDLAPGSILQMAFVPLGCVLTRGGNRWRESEEPGESPSQGRAPFEAGSLRHPPNPPPSQMHLLPLWPPFILVQVSQKRKCNFQTYLQRKCKLIKKKEREGKLVPLPTTWSLWLLRVNCLEGKKAI